MKHMKMCPKCGSNDILTVDGYCGAYGVGNNIMVGLTIFSAVPVDRYVCCSCGYSEEWIRREDIEKVKDYRRAHRDTGSYLLTEDRR
ncbi:MAG: hypothetical protein J6Z38_06085 [Lachnospiraceae bacterium]|nr:hypothetical protein [Lachnospiraceae bacterium]